MMPVTEFDLRLKDSAVEPGSDSKTVVRTDEAKRPRYKVWIYLEGSHLYLVDSVTYILHPSFSPREVKVVRTVNNEWCALEIWTWGVFELTAVVTMKTGQTVMLKHYMQYDKEISRRKSEFEIRNVRKLR
jgi:transcription initiation factor IIF auxiliary subunit